MQNYLAKYRNKESWLLVFLTVMIWVFLVWITIHKSYALYLRQGWELREGYIFLRAFLIWGVPVFFSPLIIKLCQKNPIERDVFFRNLSLHVIFSLVFVLIHAIVFRTGMIIFEQYEGRSQDASWSLDFFFTGFSTILIWLVIVSPLMYWLVAGSFHIKKYYEEYKSEFTEKNELEAELAAIRLQVLKDQLHPHFLFNTLHSVNTLLYKDRARARNIIRLLKKFLKISLTEMNQQLLLLKQELKFTEIYLEIIKIRFRNRLSIIIDVDDRALGAQVPGLLLQPLVENAVKHGVEKKIGNSIIKISAHKDEHFLNLSIEDDGPGLKDEVIRKGIGLTNIQKRLEYLYDEFNFNFIKSPLGGLKVVIQIPCYLNTHVTGKKITSDVTAY